MATSIKIRLVWGVFVLLAAARGSVLLILAGALGEQLEEDGECLQPGECVASARKYKPKCSIYMAPSSVHGLDGMGIFTTEALADGDELLSAYDGPSIPVLDYNKRWYKGDGLEENRKRWNQLFDDYWWGRGVPDHTRFEAQQVMDFQITFGSLPNHHCALDCLDVSYPNPSYDDTLLDPFHSPGIGAISYHNGRIFHVTKNLTAGSEIFLNYGHCNREAKHHPRWGNYIPMRAEYTDAASYTLHIWDSLEGDLSDTSQVNGVIAHYRNDIQDSIVRRLVPDSAARLLQVLEGLKRWDMAELKRRLAMFVGATPRSPDWIRENGLCVENLVPGTSHIPEAGRGGFAQFAMSKGEIIVPVPTLQVINKDVLLIPDRRSGEVIGTQLLLNYCFGHMDSSLLLCPITNAILINHCSSRKPNPACMGGPNAKLRWSSAWDTTTPRWLEMTMEELASQDSRGLSLEIVALRDIERGEEVFIDYGKEWEDAWERHLASWTPPLRHRMHMSAKKANANPEQYLEFFLSNDLRKMKEHPNLYTGCVFNDATLDSSEITTDKVHDWWVNLSDADLLGTYATDGSQFVGAYKSHSDDSHWTCQVIAPEEGRKTYTVRIMMGDKHAPMFLTNYPIGSIHFFYRPYGSDQHLPKAFRHHVGIPDEIMPLQWKNRVENEEDGA